MKKVQERRVAANSRLLLSSASILALLTSAQIARAQQASDVGSVTFETSGQQPRTPAAGNANGAAPITSDAAIGLAAPLGSAPNLAPSQANLSSTEPGSVVSGRAIQDIATPGSDYNNAAKFTPNFVTSNSNGSLGDAKSSWRGFADGQFNVTFDGIPFGDENDPTHHSAAYFPPTFIGHITVDRGPGEASTIGYATFGGTLGLWSLDLSNKFGGSVGGSVGSFGTYTGYATLQSGLVGGDTRGMVQYSYASTAGAISLGHVDQNQFLVKIEKKMGDFTTTFFSTFGRENYNNIAAITWAQLQAYGKSYGAVNNNPLTQQFVGYNNSQKQTDMEYIDFDGTIAGWKVDNKIYTYAYNYPSLQNNGNNQALEGPDTIANGGTVASVSITNPPSSCTPSTATCKTGVSFLGVNNGDVTGYLKYNNYRAEGDILKLSNDIHAGAASGQVRLGLWVEHGDNDRYQQYYDYTQKQLYSALNPVIASGATNPAQNAIDLASSSYKLFLNSHITTVQPYVEYEWKPTDNLSITPGYKFISFDRLHLGMVNQTTLQPVNFDKTYTSNLPYITIRYKIWPDLTIYAQASKGYLAPTVSAYYVLNFNTNTLAPEQTTNYQAGAVYKSETLSASADIYQITAVNFPITTTNPDGTTSYQNAGTARYRGIEGETTWAFGKQLAPNTAADGFGLYASGAVSSASFIAGPNNGFAVPDAPRYTAAGGLVYDNGMFFGSLLEKVTGDFYGSSGQVASTATVNNQLNHVGAWNQADFVMGVRSDFLKKIGFGEKAEFKVGVTNIFNRTSITEIAGAPSTLTAADPKNALTYTFQSGRLIYAGMKVDF